MNKIYINKKLILPFLIIIILSITLFRTIDNTIYKDFNLSVSEIKTVRSNDHQLIEVDVSNHFLWTEENFEFLQQQIETDLGLNISFRPFSDEKTTNTVLFKFPSGLYQPSGQLRPIHQYGYIKDEFQLESPSYDSLESYLEAFDTNMIDALLLPYQGDYIFADDLKLVQLSVENSQPIYYETSNADINPILEKAFNQYLKDGTVDQLLNRANILHVKNHIHQYLSTDELNLFIDNKELRVGIENYPSIAYINNQNIYGLAVALMNNFSDFFQLEVEYTVGEHDNLNELLLKKDLDLILTTQPDGHAYKFYSEPLVIISHHDATLYESFDALSDKIFVVYQHDLELDLKTSDFKTLIEDINSSESHYYILSKSMYELINSKIDAPTLYLNLISKESIDYYYVGDQKIIELISRYTPLIDNNRLHQLSLLFIPDETKKKTNWYMALFTIGLIGFIAIVIIVVKVIMSINERQRLNYLFKHDQLTYLLNGYGLKKLFNSISKKSGVMLLIDLRHFKLINDTYGSTIGDQILIELADKFKSIDEKMIVARTSGDQYTFLVNQKEFEHYKQEILSVFTKFKSENSHAKKLSISACYVEFPEFSDDYDTLVQYLESTMYYAKSKNIIHSWVSFNHNIYNDFLKEQEMAIEIQTALENEDFLLFYQPQTDLETEQTIGAEVLVRWLHKERGNIYPDQFLGVAERNGLMRKLDMYMIKKACQQIKIWQESSYDQMKISVNMSTYTFESADMSKELIQIIEESQIKTSWFAIEITEESGFSNLKYAKNIMDEIKRFGVRFALDDFGKGYSSLSYLEQLPFDFLKIDKAFVDNIHTNDKSRTLYYLITDLAKLYDMHIIAEGVEYLDQINIIKKDMTTIIQGYYYSKPLPLTDFEARIKNQIDRT
ncbi:MAG: bifunctional diguanylate cyclase/phosphodiesterase [Clostridiales bacterium]|nr:bifunctional diguanylate cyclase/phosphodiesterase [Clostridiales bacterium]